VSERLPSSARLFRIIPKTRVHFGLIIAIAMFIACRYYMFRTRWGYRLRVTGANTSFARYAGINIMAVIMSSQVLGGMIAGMGGAIEILGMYRRFSWQALPGYGWDGIIVAILARNNPVLVPAGAFFLAYLRIGADLMARTSDVQNEVVTIIQGIMIVLIAAESFLSSMHQRMVYKTAWK
ncbi:MAG: ABC transporter permease, partial [spirochete symbiont of Stewartia floridana]